jgi:hypothetical protein
VWVKAFVWLFTERFQNAQQSLYDNFTHSLFGGREKSGKAQLQGKTPNTKLTHMYAALQRSLSAF